MRKLGWFSILILTYSNSTFSQHKICECAPFFSPLAAVDFESFFDPPLIKSKRITEVKIYITSSQKNNKNKTDTVVKVVDQKYIKETFAFNRDGYAIQSSGFSLGNPNYHYSFNRDMNNDIIQYVAQFFDSAGKVSTDSSPTITDYTFDEFGNILKSKKRGFNGAILPDDKSEYTITEYNNQGWKTKETTHYYWDWQEHPHHFNVTYYSYTNKGKTEIAKTFEDKKLFLRTTTNYDETGAPLTISSFNYFMNKPAYKKVFKYDSLGRLIKYVQSSSGGGGSDCPAKGNFYNEFKYNSVGLLVEQRHTFANIVCILQFEYR